MKKLLLEEDNIMLKDNQQLSNLITQMIQQEWQSVDFYNGMLITLQEYNSPELVQVIDDIVNQHYTSIGQLENVLQSVNPIAELIDNEDDVIES